MADVQRFVLMPRDGLRDKVMTSPLLQPGGGPKLLSAMTLARGPKKKPQQLKDKIRVIHSLHEDGLKLVEMTPDAVFNLRATLPGVRCVPVVYYRTANRPKFQIQQAVPAGRASGNIRVTVKSSADGAPLAGAYVMAFTDFAKREAADGTTDANGAVTLVKKRGSLTVERLYIYPPHFHWGYYATQLRIADGDSFTLQRLDLGVPDFITSLYGAAADSDGQDVKVGVIDTGIALGHPDLTVAGGMNLVTGEKSGDFGPSADHGTHVAGIIAARGSAPTGKRGIAPGAMLRSYRVFGQGVEDATNYDIARAIDQAVADGCHLVNMSLGGGPQDPAVEESVNGAYKAGTLCICAAGNDYRGPVSFPARLQEVLAVTALGQRGTFPRNSVETADVVAPFAASNRDRFVAAFSNFGQEVALTAPGVGIISTVPDKDYAVMSGTSMACPAVTGRVAAILSQQPGILGMAADAARTQAITQAVLQKAIRQGFTPNGPHLEGHGLL